MFIIAAKESRCFGNPGQEFYSFVEQLLFPDVPLANRVTHAAPCNFFVATSTCSQVPTTKGRAPFAQNFRRVQCFSKGHPSMERCLSLPTCPPCAHGCIRQAETPIVARLPLRVATLRCGGPLKCQGANLGVETCEGSWTQQGGREKRLEVKKSETDMLESVLWSAHDIQARVAELGQAISTDYEGHPVVILGVATGAFMFLADLVRHITLPLQVDLIRVQSYGNDTKTSGVATISTDCKIDLKDKHVIVVEDMIDTGTTLTKLVKHVSSKGAASVSVSVMVDKASRRVVPVELSGMGKCYVGFECPDAFVVGYGMDFAERFRSLPCIGVLKPEVYQQASSQRK